MTSCPLLVRQYIVMEDIHIKNYKKYYIQRSSSEEGQDGQVVLCKSRYVSKMHCRIFMKDDKYWIEDLASTNGTYLNGVHITCFSPRELYYGDLIGIGVDCDDMNVDFSNEQYFVFKFLKQAERVFTAVDENDVTIIKEYRRCTCPSFGHKFTEKDSKLKQLLVLLCWR